MGADGHLLIVKREEWDKDFFDVDPESLGLWSDVFLGIPVLFSYNDTDGRDNMAYGEHLLSESVRDNYERANYIRNEYGGSYKDFRGQVVTSEQLEKEAKENSEKVEYQYSLRCLEAADWFYAESENHMIWT